MKMFEHDQRSRSLSGAKKEASHLGLASLVLKRLDLELVSVSRFGGRTALLHLLFEQIQ